jgi:hypothetical protein
MSLREQNSRAEGGENRAPDFPAIEGGAPEPAPQSRRKQYRRKPEKKEIGPRKVSGYRELGKEKKIANESD